MEALYSLSSAPVVSFNTGFVGDPYRVFVTCFKGATINLVPPIPGKTFKLLRFLQVTSNLKV